MTLCYTLTQPQWVNTFLKQNLAACDQVIKVYLSGSIHVFKSHNRIFHWSVVLFENFSLALWNTKWLIEDITEQQVNDVFCTIRFFCSHHWQNVRKSLHLPARKEHSIVEVISSSPNIPYHFVTYEFICQ